MTDPDRTEDWLREGLADAVPQPPGEPGRAEAARGRARRARRRTALVAAAGVVATLAVVGVVTTTLRDGSGREEATAAPSPLDAPGCPEKPVDAQTQVGPDHVPDGALSVRLCNGDAVPIDVPRDALVTRVDDVAAAVNELEVADPARACTLDLGPGFQLVFTYPDNKSVVASGGLYGCREVVVHGVERTGAEVPWERFFELLQSQREQMDPPGPQTSAGDCDAPPGTTPSATPLGRPEDLAVAALCVAKGDAEPAKRADIAADDLALLVADIRTNQRANAGLPSCIADHPPIPRIVGLTAWGDRVDFSALCGPSRFLLDARNSTVWEPGPDAAVVLEQLVATAE